MCHSPYRFLGRIRGAIVAATVGAIVAAMFACIVYTQGDCRGNCCGDDRPVYTPYYTSLLKAIFSLFYGAAAMESLVVWCYALHVIEIGDRVYNDCYNVAYHAAICRLPASVNCDLSVAEWSSW